MVKPDTTFFQTLRLPILRSKELIYVSGIPGAERSLRVIFPGRHFLPFGTFCVALQRAHYNEIVDRGRTTVRAETTAAGVALHVEIATRADESGPSFSITLSPAVVQEIAAAFRLAAVIQDHYTRFTHVEICESCRDVELIERDTYLGGQRLALPSPDRDGALMLPDAE